ncbi:MAG TPA: gliding motility-associated C-terminal domain-containing protein [Bacteroidales bacterium]|nr:gliding motility-associated C-terminal domain-containing protein [Bacteroidales bacterium]
MTVRFSNLAFKPLCLLLMFFTILSLEASGQKKLSGNLNQPFAHVTSIFDADEVDVDDASRFKGGDTVLVIQMQGVGIMIDPGVYGNYQTSFGTPGGYEFLIIDGKSGNRITFRNNLVNNYNIKGNIQLVRVPYYISATVSGNLFCDPWDPSTGKGGVLALILGRTISLDADIDLSGHGLRGAPVTAGDGTPRIVAGTTASSYPFSFTNAGIKGEGIAIHDEFGNALYPVHAKGEGKNYTGGGGGNGKFSGGGGGSFRGNGGRGGFEDYYPPELGGLGGVEVRSSLSDRIFLGGGGGSSTSMSGPGGNGGGIVIIVSDSVIGNGHKIIANGAKGGDAVSTGGAGGGGAGGTIALSLSSYGASTSPLGLMTAGGKGGNNINSFGEGGGGGGGLIYVSTQTTSNVSINFEGGNAGDPGGGATAGTAGYKQNDFKVLLNGFLFNSIRSSITGNDIDSVCSNQVPPAITGTTPVGGTAPYKYKWQKSYDNITWITLFEDNSSINYTPGSPEANTVYYRRVITDSSIPTALVDVSKEVKVIVHPFIKNNTIGSPQIICYNQDPVALVSTGTLADGNGKYTFKWEFSADNVTYATPSSSFTLQSYNPSALTASAWYKRTVTSGRCVDISAPVSVTVLPDISNNKILSPDQDICYGMAFDNLTGSTSSTSSGPLTGGDNTFRFKWESNINSSGWIPAPGLNTTADYNPGELAEKSPMNDYYFRRVVYSGLGDVCSATSNTVHLRDYPVITNNKISSPQTICSDAVPAILTGTSPSNGNGVFSYTWQDSTKAHTWTDIPGFIKSSSSDFQPPALRDTIRYRRIAYSSACSDVSKSLRINVHKPLTNYGISTLSGLTDTTICYGQDPFRLTGEKAAGGTNLPGSYTYQWYSSANNIDFTPIATSGTGTGYDPAALSSTTFYRRESRSGACTTTSGTVKVEVLSLIGNNTLSGNQTICFNSAPSQIKGAATTGGSGTFSYRWEESFDGGLTWVAAAGTNTSADYTYPSALTVPGKFRRVVSSGRNNNCCSNISDPVDVLIHPPLPTARIVSNQGSDSVFYSGTPVILKLNLTGSGPWKVTWTENSVPASADVSTNNPELSINPNESGSATFEFLLKEVRDKNGCLASDMSGKLIATVFPGFEIPEGFSPNGDGINDLFSIKGLNPGVPENQLIDMKIITSAGSEVFRSSNYDGQQWQDWDGTDLKGNELAEGTYYYLMNIKTVLNGVTFKKSGFIILKR